MVIRSYGIEALLGEGGIPMKKTVLRPLVFVALVLALTMAAACALAADFGVIYRTDTLNLRAQGSSSSQWLGSYSRGTWVEIIGSENNFYRVVAPDGRIGYMSKNYIDFDNNTSWTVEVSNQNGGAFLNFRSQPSYNASVYDIFYNGVPLLVNSKNGGWYCVSINGQTGYVRQEYVQDMGWASPGSENVYTIKTPNNSALNLRSGPGMNHGVIGQFYGDQYVMVLASGSGWSRVCVDGFVGYMSNDFLVEGLQAARDLSADKSTTTSGQPYAVVNNPKSTQALNLRQSASTASRVLDKLYNGEKLWLNEVGSTWCAVTDQTTGLSGYVMTKYIKLYNTGNADTMRMVYHPNGSWVNLRSAPQMGTNNVITRVQHGDWVTVLSPGQDWCKVQYNGYTGYMMSYFLQ